MEKLWHYEKGNQAHGPISESELVNLIADGSIREDTLVWSHPMESWAQASSMEELKQHFTPKPPPLPNNKQVPPLLPLWEQYPFKTPSVSTVPPQLKTAHGEESETIYPREPMLDGVSQVQPWSRFVAKMIDYYIFVIIVAAVLVIFFPGFAETHKSLAQFTLWPLLGVLLVLIEPFFLSRYGKTLGKHIFGINIRHRDGSFLSYNEAINRTFNVWMKGIGFNIFLVSWITIFIQYRKLQSSRITSWDREGGYSVVHKKQNKFLPYILFLTYICLEISVFILDRYGYIE